MKIARPIPALAFLIAGTLTAQEAKVTPLLHVKKRIRVVADAVERR
jgi:hypothetical protein